MGSLRTFGARASLAVALGAAPFAVLRCHRDPDAARVRGAVSASSGPSGAASSAVPLGSADQRAGEDPAGMPPGSAERSPLGIAKLDLHTHIDPDVAEPARDFMQAAGIGRVVNLSGGSPGEGLEETLAAAQRTSGFYVVFANVDFSGIGAPGWAAREAEQLARAKAMGARGVKIAKNLGLGVRYPDGRRVPVDDPVLDPLFDAMARLRLPLAIHTGDPKAFFDPVGPENERMDELASHPMWSFADRTRFPSWEGLYGEFERRVKRSSGTTIIGVHFGNAPEEPERVGRMLDTYANFFVDTAARVPELGRRPAAVRRVILAHADRVLFGTDTQLGRGTMVLGAGESRGHTQADVDRFFSSTWRFFETADRDFLHPTPIQGRWNIAGVDLPRDVLEKVYHRNAERLLGLPATSVTPAHP
jgi:predicted TIM-barrel fold metal-dependent hydrolase